MTTSTSDIDNIIPATLTQVQAAQYLGISIDMLQRMCRPDLRAAGLRPLPLPPKHIRIRSRVLYRAVDLDAWLERQANASAAQTTIKRGRGRPRKFEALAA